MVHRAWQAELIKSRFSFKSSRLPQRPRALVLLDRDGTIVKDRGYLAEARGLELEVNAAAGLRCLQEEGFSTAVVSNQSGLARGRFTFKEFSRVHQGFEALLSAHSLDLHMSVYCPFYSGGTVPPYNEPSIFRKPSTGMFSLIANWISARPLRVFCIGDKVSDVHFGNLIGAESFLLRTGHGEAALKDANKLAGLKVRVQEDLLDASKQILKEF